ncbi:cupin domain-containing protein [Roseomonas rosulenta]|uniref:cupin domain-containing protein n=1 Tax=Roseomonas rosulenta TaxID=2748667 RepID=UPI0018DF316A
MSGRRFFAGCALCAAVGLVAGGRQAGAQPAAAQRRILQTTEVPGTDRVTHLVVVDFPPNGGNPRHIHPGVTTGLVLTGELELAMDGQAALTLKPGDSLLIPNRQPHVERAGAAGCSVVVSFTVEKGQPLAMPAPA